MNLYQLLRPLLFKLDAEMAHEVTLKLLDVTYMSGLSKLVYPKIEDKPVFSMGLNFKNPVGLAAGMDKNGLHIDALAEMGFGFIEVGTVTPCARNGNNKPRMFRDITNKAIINNMGLNNLGVDNLLIEINNSKYEGILGINIGVNNGCVVKESINDYLTMFWKVYSAADYVVINISCPNVPLGKFHKDSSYLKILFDGLKKSQYQLQLIHGKYTPIVIKIAPNLSNKQIFYLSKTLEEFCIDGVIASNTMPQSEGGLSGKPLDYASTETIKLLKRNLNGNIAIIASGGVMTAQDAQTKLNEGASLVQVFTGLVYSGPQLIKDIVDALKEAGKPTTP